MMVAHLGDYFWGRSPFYQVTLHGYGMHTFSHLATTVLAGATPREWRRRYRSSCPSGSLQNGRCGPTGSRCALTDG